jgi:hypothetical protein
MSPQVYQFKISLVGIQPLIWRRFRVYSDVTFRQLHNIVQIVMGWENYHLYQFFWNYDRFSEQLMGNGDRRASHILGEFVTQPGSILGYEYDFGDSWHHELLLEKVLTRTRKPCPICTHGQRACPPEDCGSIWGYMELSKAMKAKRGARYREYKEWLGGYYDVNAFDLVEVNEQLTDSRLWQ